jgi:hypothetical protein
MVWGLDMRFWAENAKNKYIGCIPFHLHTLQLGAQTCRVPQPNFPKHMTVE